MMTLDRYDPLMPYLALCRAAFEDHAPAWRPPLVALRGAEQAERLIAESRALLPEVVRAMPYIGGSENRLLRHLVHSATSLALYEALHARGDTAAQVGRIIYCAVAERVRQLPPQEPASPAELDRLRAEALHSRERRYAEDWIWDFVEGDGTTFEYGYDFFHCPTLSLYRARGAEAFLPYYCRLDFITYRVPGWTFQRTMTLGEGGDRCDFRFRRSGAMAQR